MIRYSLSDRKPDFLSYLNSDPERAVREFYVFTVKFMQSSAPRVILAIPPEERESLTHDIVVRCIDDNCRVLRQYRDQGKPFAAWLYRIARNMIIDIIKPHKVQGQAIQEVPFDDFQNLETGVRVNVQSEEVRQFQSRVLEQVNECLRQLNEHCQLLLRMAAREFNPQEMAQVLRWDSKKAKKISDDLRYCREKLKNLLSIQGIDPSAVI